MNKDQNGDVSDDQITEFFKRYERRGSNHDKMKS